MASLVIIIPILFFATIAAICVGLFGVALPFLATVPALSWVADSWFVALLKVVIIVVGVVMPMASILTWMERRQSAVLQDRLGPNRAKIGSVTAFGLIHFLADAMKMMFKEDFIPAKANKALFALAPILAIAPVFIVFAIVPFGSGICPGQLGAHLSDEALATCIDQGGVRFQIAHLEVGMLFYFAIASLAVYGTTLAGWASYNKWSLLGGLRASSQMMSYEVTMGMAILGTFLVYGTLEPAKIVELQGASPTNWGIVMQPLGFLIFFTASIAESKRTPFDLPEGEPEVIGYFVEYSGLRFGMFYLAEFIEVVFIGAMISTIFLGGYQLPGLHAGGFTFLADVPGLSIFSSLPHWLVALIQITTFGFKVYFMCWFQLMIRWTLPRLRPDQLMNLGWKGLLPLSIANILVTAGLVLYFGAQG